MIDLLTYSAISGVLFGLWPLFMQRSGIKNVDVSTVVMEMIVLAVLLPFGLRNVSTFDWTQMSWVYTILASVSAAFGVLIFNTGLSKSSDVTLSTYFVVMIVIQTSVPAVYEVFKNGMSVSKFIGFMLAGLAAYFLLK